MTTHCLDQYHVVKSKCDANIFFFFFFFFSCKCHENMALYIYIYIYICIYIYIYIYLSIYLYIYISCKCDETWLLKQAGSARLHLSTRLTCSAPSPSWTRDLILGDNALLYITYVMLIWAPLIPATRWSCSRSQLILEMTADCSST